MKKKGRALKWIILVLLLLLIAAGACAVIWNQKKTQEDTTRNLTTQSVVRGTMIVTTEGNGAIEAASTKAVTLEYDGKLEEIFVEKGDQVSIGDELAVYDTDALDRVIDAKEAELEQMGSQISSMSDSGSTVIKAPVSGRVKRIFVTSGDVAANVTDLHGGIAEISADGKLRVDFVYNGANLNEGDQLKVDFGTHTETGTVVKIEEQIVSVTIDDDTSYQVDETATIWGKSGEKIGEGILKSNHPFLVTANYGIIDSVEVNKERFVNAGDTMFTRKDAKYNQAYLDLLTDREELIEELTSLKEYRKNPVVTSEYDGYIVTMDAMEGMTYEKEQQLCTIADEETLSLKIDIDELDIDGVKVGQTAEVTFDAFENEIYTGTVKKISGVGTNIGGVTTYTVTIEMNGDAHLKNAMSATAVITLETRDNALLIPVDSVESFDGKKYAEVLQGSEVIEKEITVGLVNDEYAEILDGLSEGEQVVVINRQSTDFFTEMMNRSYEMREQSREAR